MKRLIHYIPTLVVASGIAYVSLIREVGFSVSLFAGWDKVVHFLMYCSLAVTMLCDVSRDKRISKKTYTVICLFCVVYGGMIEILQERFFYPRTGDWWDWIADCLGVVFGISVTILLWKVRKKDGIC